MLMYHGLQLLTHDEFYPQIYEFDEFTNFKHGVLISKISKFVDKLVAYN
jgi:hypothetical protein